MSIWFGMVLTPIITWVLKYSLTLTYPPNINTWQVLQFWYPWVCFVMPLSMLIIDTMHLRMYWSNIGLNLIQPFNHTKINERIQVYQILLVQSLTLLYSLKPHNDNAVVKVDIHAKCAFEWQPLFRPSHELPTQQNHDHFPLWHFVFPHSNQLQVARPMCLCVDFILAWCFYLL